jgi:hypothetical protein
MKRHVVYSDETLISFRAYFIVPRMQIACTLLLLLKYLASLLVAACDVL